MQSDLAVIEPTLKQPTNPGVTVEAITSISSILCFDSSKAFSRTKGINSKCFLAASSGTTPPHFE